MTKLLKKFNDTLFDVASGPVVLAFFGVTVFIVIAVAVLVIAAVLLIIRAVRKNKAEMLDYQQAKHPEKPEGLLVSELESKNISQSENIQ